MSSSVPHTESRPWYAVLLRPMLLIAGIGVATKGLQVVSAVLLARNFGASGDTDAYLLSKSAAIGAYLIADSILYNALVPLYRRRQSASPAFRGFLSAVFLASIGAGAVVGAVLILRSGLIISILAPGADASAHALASRLAQLAGMAVVLSVPVSFLKAMNASEGRYVLAALDGLVMYVMLALALLFAPREWGVWPITAALPAAFVALCAIQAFPLRRTMPLSAPSWNNPHARQAAALVAPLVALNCLQQINLFVMMRMASYVGSGAISWLNYSYNIAQAPVAVIELILFSSVLPFASALSSEHHLDELKGAFLGMLRVLLLFLAPISAWVVLSRYDVVQALLERRFFESSATQATALCLLGHGLAIIPWSIEALASRCLFALKRHWVFFSIVAVRVLANFGLCLLLVPRYRQLGVSMAFALSFGVGATLACVAVLRMLHAHAPMRLGGHALGIGGRALLGVGIVWCVVAGCRYGLAAMPFQLDEIAGRYMLLGLTALIALGVAALLLCPMRLWTLKAWRHAWKGVS